MKIHFNRYFWRSGSFYMYLFLLFLWLSPFLDGPLPQYESLMCIFFIIFIIGSILKTMFYKE
ncbi:hypothetical protein EAI26_00765 [Lactobacillus sp. 0.1XD8-4]|uniref:Uncharacterized protein n=1 Tax=Limosilactobacillus walteri TaxID=2268022 RepID=A0ABR8P612_9LACO|nr:hypothetical protein [Limosilactobacillus walteri]MRN05940.1 hypothetical protein [Lactobacillus sp. 0.1XD8-4]